MCRASILAFALLFMFSRSVAAEPKTITNSIGMRLVLIPAGEFVMGASNDDPDAQYYSKPQHRVRITTPFYMGVHEVTRGQFAQFVAAKNYQTEAERDGKGGWGYDASKNEFENRQPKYTWRNTGWDQTDNHPVVNISFNDAQEFCRWLSRVEAKNYSLPSEAQWEYACRAGTTTKYSNGDAPEGVVKIGNVADQSFKTRMPNGYAWCIDANDHHVFAAPVGSFQPNDFGLYDMSGNACEWCSDWFDPEYYRKSDVDDPIGPAEALYPANASNRVARGGSWSLPPHRCRAVVRYPNESAFRFYDLGFRVTLVPSS